MLSPESRAFLDDLRLYLYSYGKKEEEIEEIVSELEDHLREAEKRGKSIHDVTGGSPQAYMEQLRQEMSTDRKEVVSALLSSFPLAMSYVMLPDLVRGRASYNWLDVVGYPLLFIGTLAGFILLMRLEASRSLSKLLRWGMYVVVGVLPTLLFLAIILAGRFLELSPIFVPTPVQSWVIAAILILFLLGNSIYNRTWLTIIVPVIFVAPEYIADLFTTSPQSHALLSLGIMYAMFFLLMGVTFWRSRSKG